MASGVAVVVGAGPAGLTAAWELLQHTGVVPVVVETTEHLGGISRTEVHQGNRIDIGGHRFFSKSDRVMKWWLDVLPLEGVADRDSPPAVLAYHQQRRLLELPVDGPDPAREDRVMLLRRRQSRILHGGRLFDYPINLDLATLRQLGPWRATRIGASYLRAVARPIRPEATLEDFLINRFGVELYRSFFQQYTEKVWGVPCDQIPAAWGAQRIKGLSISRALAHAVRRRFTPDHSLGQKQVETSLIERFLYPKLGPGQLWQEVARRVEDRGGRVLRRHRVTALHRSNGAVRSVQISDLASGTSFELAADWVLSSMPVPHLVASLAPAAPQAVCAVASGLEFRHLITVGVLVSRLRPLDPASQPPPRHLLPDTWLYIQEPDVDVGRIQVFNNWSPYLVADPDTVWLGLEYFCAERGRLWSQDDGALAALAVAELERVGLADPADVLTTVVVRQPRAYPSYTGAYDRFDTVQDFLGGIANLLPIGRNGMHRYNNQDHSMLAAMAAVACIAGDGRGRDAVWQVNTDPDYQETAAG